MPSVPKTNSSGLPSRVLVTGASGFVAIHVCKSLLDRGYHAIGTVRSVAKGEYLKSLFAKLGSDAANFSYVIVPDMEAAGAFDDAVKDVDAIEHVASAVTFSTGDPDLIIKPAIAGTLNILESVKKFGPNVKRVVITGSTVSVTSEDTVKRPYTFTESDWNTSAQKDVEANGFDANPGNKYVASKVLAEQASIRWHEQNKDHINFDIVTLCPPWIWGPVLQELSSVDNLNVSVAYLYQNVNGPEKEGSDLLTRHANCIDVRDVASIHVDVLEAGDAVANQRLLLGASPYDWQSIYDALNEEPAIPGIHKGQPGATKGKTWDILYSTAKVEKALGKSHSELFRPLEETVRDTYTSLQSRGLYQTTA